LDEESVNLMSEKQRISNETKFEQIGNLNPKHKRPISITILSIIICISGVVFMAAVGVFFSGSDALLFLVSDFGVLPMPSVITGIMIILTGVILIAAGVGIWRLRLWGFALGLTVSFFLIAIALLAVDFTSFAFIRGVIVVVYLLAVRRNFNASTNKKK
jgi:hypothetical protein